MPQLRRWCDRRKATIGSAIALGNIGYNAILWPVATDTSKALPVNYLVLAALLTVKRRRR